MRNHNVVMKLKKLIISAIMKNYPIIAVISV